MCDVLEPCPPRCRRCRCRHPIDPLLRASAYRARLALTQAQRDPRQHRAASELVDQYNNLTPARYAGLLELVTTVYPPPARYRRATTRLRISWYRSCLANVLHRAGLRTTPVIGRRRP